MKWTTKGWSMSCNLDLRIGGSVICTVFLLKVPRDLMLTVLRTRRFYKSTSMILNCFIKKFPLPNDISGSLYRMHTLLRSTGYRQASGKQPYNVTRNSKRDILTSSKGFPTTRSRLILELLRKA